MYIYIYMNKFKQDFNLGIKSENKVLKFLNESYEDKFISTTQNCPFDFTNNQYNIELKTRNNTYNKYPSTMVGYNKIKIAEEDNTDKKYKFLFLFKDGLYCWDFEKDKYTIKTGGRRDRGLYEYKQYAYIPIEELYLISKEILND